MRIGTNWAEEDSQRYTEGLIAILRESRQYLGEENFSILWQFLPEHAREMARTVMTNSPPPPLFVDAFLADFRGRIQTIAQTGYPVLPSEDERILIKAQLTQYIDQLLPALENRNAITDEERTAVREHLLAVLYRKVDHPAGTMESGAGTIHLKHKRESGQNYKWEYADYSNRETYGNPPEPSNFFDALDTGGYVTTAGNSVTHSGTGTHFNAADLFTAASLEVASNMWATVFLYNHGYTETSATADVLVRTAAVSTTTSGTCP